MNHEPTVTQYLTKNELYEEFGRHPRTITKDITKAIARGDQELLSLAQLHTKNGRIIEATAATSTTWKKLSDEGENPAWYFSPEFVEIVRQRNSKQQPRRRNKPTHQAPKSAEKNVDADSVSFERNRGAEPILPDDPSARAIVLEHLQFQSLKHASENKELMDRILKLVETNQQLQSQTNSLFNQFQVALQEGVISSAMVPTKGDSSKPTQSQATPAAPNQDVIVVEDNVVAQSTSKRKPKKNTKRKTKSIQTKASRTKTGTAKKASGKKKSKIAKTTKAAKPTKQRKGFFNRLFSSNG